MRNLVFSIAGAMLFIISSSSAFAQRTPTPLRNDETWATEPEQDCNDKAIIERVCGLGGLSTPVVADSTGLGLTFTDLEITQARKVSQDTNGTAYELNQNGYQRFLVSAQMVAGTLLQKAGRHGVETQSLIQSRLNSLSFISLEQLNQNFQKFKDSPKTRFLSTIGIDTRSPIGCSGKECGDPRWNANAVYAEGWRTIIPLPAIINNSELSHASILFIVAHEMGHHLDPRVEAESPLSANLDPAPDAYSRQTLSKIFGEDAIRCFGHTFLGQSYSKEAFADWLASVTMNEVIKKIPEGLNRLRFAQNMARPFCSGVNTMETDGHHPPIRNRIATIFRQPELRNALNCSKKILVTERAEVPACSF